MKKKKKIRLLDHTDAGAAVCLQNKHIVAAAVDKAHHRGILTQDGLSFNLYQRQPEIIRNRNSLIVEYPQYKSMCQDENKTVQEYVDENLPHIFSEFQKSLGMDLDLEPSI